LVSESTPWKIPEMSSSCFKLPVIPLLPAWEVNHLFVQPIHPPDSNLGATRLLDGPSQDHGATCSSNLDIVSSQCDITSL
jgi:hypothetical protein